MSASEYDVGPSVKVTPDGPGYRVESSPLPVHRGSVRLSVTLNRWVVRIHTAGVLATDHADVHTALRVAGSHIGALYRVDMRSRFTGPQRRALGLGQCPSHIRCVNPGGCPIERPDHSHLCRGNPETGSVWCERHQARGEGGP